ncbi:hypothetical protein [Poseidonibacter ostreae]|uniref:Uncharacterized protein n=1 Tax=Poseidonibacter ostreae TaxID=2654171 RepID=A0A6L4WQZ6_9BACT|nr:hypothetical protein [Poseidonibacter ostreae]KAB7887421.1 hypothetical protein GBG19_10730 [Poseidonibacter ostreae]
MLIADENGDWLRGDIVGLLTSYILEALAVPVSCNTTIEELVCYKDYKSFAGFLLKQDDALPTRDALLPFIVLASKRRSIFIKTCRKITTSDRIQNSMKLLEKTVSNPKELLKSIGLEDLKVIDINQIDGLRLTLDNKEIIR